MIFDDNTSSSPPNDNDESMSVELSFAKLTGTISKSKNKNTKGIYFFNIIFSN